MLCTADLSKENSPCFSMGEKPSGRMLVIAGLLVTSLFIGLVSADQGDVALLVDVQDAPEEPWYEPGQPLILAPSLVNNGPEISLTVNPACPFVLNVYNTSNVMVVNGSSSCPAREQGLDLFAGERLDFSPMEWSMKDADGTWLESGTYQVELVHSAGFSHTTLATIQTPVQLPSTLVYDVQTTQRTDSSGPLLYMVNLHNPTEQSVDLTSDACQLEISVDRVHRLGSSCTGSVNTLMPGEIILVEQFTANPTSFVSIATPGADLAFASPGEDSPAVPSGLSMELGLSGNELPAYGPGEILVSEVLLSPSQDESALVEFTSSCKAEMWIVDDLGQLVYDSRVEKNCQDIDLELTVSSDDPERLTLPQWNFFDMNGCLVGPGVYTVVAEVPEHGLTTSQHVRFHSSEANPCVDADIATLDASLAWEDEQTLRIEAVVHNDEPYHLRMAQPCTFEIAFLDQREETVHAYQTLCDAYDGRKILLPDASEPLQFDALDVRMVQDGTPILPDGFYTLKITVLSTSTSSVSLPFAWPADFGEAEDEGETASTIERFEIVGTWVGLLTEQGTCYMLDNDGTTHLLSNARTLPSWRPSSELQGVYTVQSAAASPACGDYLAPSVEVVDVRMETSNVVDEGSNTVNAEEPSVLVIEPSSPAPVITVVVSASILSLFVVAAFTNEGLRLPATAAGLWFLGLIGKTHETTDGRYQRGRLMGYLTANPGCHFRALMSALDMSNGQITHHLRVLEAEEHVWRKNDGRLVRFYPLTNKLHPNTREEDLPVPLLSPDPNSLQGKILNLLDNDGGLGQFPTQAELAKRLEKSQQLISHHLRTLQKYGLVERRKMGVKNRYKLTREAVFLLETNDDFAHDDMA